MRLEDDVADATLAARISFANCPPCTPRDAVERYAHALCLAMRLMPQACEVSQSATAAVAASHVREFYERREGILLATLVRALILEEQHHLKGK